MNAYKITPIIVCLMMLIALTGCQLTSASSGGSSGTTLAGGSSILDGESGSGGSGGSSGTNPEPATMALFGIGLAGYALLKRKKMK